MKTIRLSGTSLSPLDIPEGTKIGKPMKGGKDTLEMVMDLLSKKTFDGYVMVRLEKEGDNITSYMLVKNSEPTLGVREVIKRGKKDSKKLVRKVYAGENTLEEVKSDSEEDGATIEVHSGIDVDSIIDRFSKDKAERAKVKEPRRIGLFWGGKGEQEGLEREVLEEKMKDWKEEGYDVTQLEGVVSGEMDEVKAAFEQFERDISTLEGMEAELDFLVMAGFESEVAALRGMMKDPGQLQNIREEIDALQNRKKEMGIEEEPKVCQSCATPLDAKGECPKCSKTPETKPPVKDKFAGIEPKSGHCYLIKEEKLRRSLELFSHIMGKGYSGFCITRTNPKHLKSDENLKKATMIWLTDRESSSETTIPPILERIIYEIGNFLRQEEQGCVIMDGIEYLESNNSFDAVLRFIRRIIDEVSDSKSILLVTLGPYTLEEQELKILEREMESLSL